MNTFSPTGSRIPWSRIALGCWQIAPSDGWGKGPPPEQAHRAVKQALDCGITTFDTAEGYGDGESERRLGKALGAKKNAVAIISKVWPDVDLTYAAFLERLDQTLSNLARDYVDLYLFHFPNGKILTPEGSAVFCDIMARLKETGKARFVGLSNFQASDLCSFKRRPGFFSFNEVPYNLVEREYEGENLEASREFGMDYLAYSPLAQGLLTGRFNKETPITDRVRKNNELFKEPKFSKALQVVDVLREVAKESNATLPQTALAWTLKQDNIAVAIVGSYKPEQIVDAAKACEMRLSEEQIKRLTKASDEFSG